MNKQNINDKPSNKSDLLGTKSQFLRTKLPTMRPNELWFAVRPSTVEGNFSKMTFFCVG